MTYRDLTTWQVSMGLVEACYRLSSTFPSSELYGLTSQIRRASVSIPANVAEGHCRRSTRAYMNHVSIALGSQGEVSTCVEIADRLGFIDRAQRADLKNLQKSCDSAGRLLYGLYGSLEAKLRDEGG